MHTTALHREDLEVLPLAGTDVRPLADAGDTDDTWELAELTIAPDGGTPLHALATDKLFYVLDGEVRITLGDAVRDATAGTVVRIAAGTPHAYLNHSGHDARMLVLTSGGGHLEFLAGFSRLLADGAPTESALRAHTAAYGVRLW